MPFTDNVLEFTKNYESPTSFWRWSSYAAVAAVLRDNCFRKQGESKLCPNIYVLSLASSAVYRKGEPVKLAEKLVKAVNNTKIIAGRASIQAVLEELARTETDKETGKILDGGACFLSYPELAAGIVEDPAAVGILTDIYEHKTEYKSILIGRGRQVIKNICVTMFAASNEDLLRSVYDTRAVFGGLLGRTFLIKPDEFRPANSLFGEGDKSDELKDLVEDLKKISELNGHFEITREAEKAYDDWYKPFRKNQEKVADRSGITGRLHTGILKVAMLIAAQRYELKIYELDILQAIEECTGLLQNYQTFIMSTGKSTTGEIGAIVLQTIYEAKNRILSRREILAKHWTEFDAEGLDKFITTAEQAGLIQTAIDGNQVLYKLTDKCLDMVFKEPRGEEGKT